MNIIPNFRSLRLGFVKGGLLGIIVVAALVWAGGQGVYTSLKNRQPLTLSYEEYDAERPDAEWISLTGTRLNFLNSAYTSGKYSDKVKEVYVAVESVNSTESKPAKVLLMSKDEGMIESLQNLGARMQQVKSAEDLTPDLRRMLFQVRPVDGLVKFGIHADDKTRSKLSKLDLNLAADFVILEEGEKPQMGVSAGLLIVGLLGAISMIHGTLKERRASGQVVSSPPPLPPQA